MKEDYNGLGQTSIWHPVNENIKPLVLHDGDTVQEILDILPVADRSQKFEGWFEDCDYTYDTVDSTLATLGV